MGLFFYPLKAQTSEWQLLSSIEYEFYGDHDQGILLEFFLKNVNLRILKLNLEWDYRRAEKLSAVVKQTVGCRTFVYT